MAKEERYITIPNTQEKIYEGSVVELFRLPNLQWILHYGYYNYNGIRRKGWYFSSIPADSEMPVFNEDLVRLRVIDGPDEPMPVPPGPCPPPGPYPPTPPLPPHPPMPAPIPYTSRDKKQVDEAMITLDDLEERDKFGSAWLVNGKLVRVNDSDGEGNPEYYTWNSEESKWELASLGYRYMTREEIESATGSDIVSIEWANEDGALVVTNRAATPVSPIQLSSVAHDPIYTEEELTLRIPVYGKSDLIMTIPKGEKILSVEFEANWHFDDGHDGPAIVITVSDGESTRTIAGDASSMVNLYKGKETASIKVTVSSETAEIAADVKISAVAGNPLNIDNEGLYVDLSGVVGKREIAAGYLLVADGEGGFTYAGDGIEVDTTTAISDLTNPEKKVVTANLIADAIAGAILALKLDLETQINELSAQFTLFDERLTALEEAVTAVDERLDFDEHNTDEILIANGENLVGSGYTIGGAELDTESATNNKLATEEAVLNVVGWKSFS